MGGGSSNARLASPYIKNTKNSIYDAHEYVTKAISGKETYDSIKDNAVKNANGARHKCCKDSATVDDLITYRNRMISPKDNARNRINTNYRNLLSNAESKKTNIVGQYDNLYNSVYKNNKTYSQTIYDNSLNIQSIQSTITDLSKNKIPYADGEITKCGRSVPISDNSEQVAINKAAKTTYNVIDLKTKSSGNQRDLYNAITLENRILENEKDSIYKEVNTNIREAEFKYEKIDRVNKVYSVLFYGYFALFLLFLYILIFSKVVPNAIKIFFIILFIIYPFVIQRVEKYLYFLFIYLYSFISGKVIK